MLKEKCPECGSRRVKVLGKEKAGNTQWLVLGCKSCEHDWVEEDLVTQRVDSLDLEIDSVLLGIEIFETANECLKTLGVHEEGEKGKTANREEINKCFQMLEDLEGTLALADEILGRSWMHRISTEGDINWALGEMERLRQARVPLGVRRRAGEIVNYLTSLIKEQDSFSKEGA